MEANLIDEHRIMITPMILGAGIPLQKHGTETHAEAVKNNDV